MSHEKYLSRLKEILCKTKSTEYGRVDDGELALYLLTELTALLAEVARDELPDGK